MSGDHNHPDLACRRLVEMVTDYLEGALTPQDQAQFEQHLVLCDPCVRYVEQHRSLVGALAQLPAADASDPAEAQAASRERALEAFRKLHPAKPGDGGNEP
jgi:anti-sigma factor RsiW